MPIIIALLVIIGTVSIEREVDSTVFNQVCSLPWIDLGTLLSLAFVPLLFVLAFTIRRRRSVAHRMVTNSIIVSLIVIGAVGFKLLYTPSNSTASIAALAAVAATVGWLLQRQAAFDLSRKQHTLTILLQLRQSELFNRHRAYIFSISPDREVIGPDMARDIYAQRLEAKEYEVDQATGRVKLPMVESMRYVCNYYEFLSAAVYHGDIDDALLKTSLGNIMKSSYQKFENFMKVTMDLDKKGNPKPDSAFYNFWWLINQHWG